MSYTLQFGRGTGPANQAIVGVAYGCPSSPVQPTCAMPPASRIASIEARSYRPRFGSRRTRVRSVGGGVVDVADVGSGAPSSGYSPAALTGGR